MPSNDNQTTIKRQSNDNQMPFKQSNALANKCHQTTLNAFKCLQTTIKCLQMPSSRVTLLQINTIKCLQTTIKCLQIRGLNNHKSNAFKQSNALANNDTQMPSNAIKCVELRFHKPLHSNTTEIRIVFG